MTRQSTEPLTRAEAETRFADFVSESATANKLRARPSRVP